MRLLQGQVYLHMNEPYEALAAFDRANQLSPFVGEAKHLGPDFYAQVSTGRAVASWQLGDTARAIRFQEMSVSLAPEDPNLWQGLANLYRTEGRMTDAQQALMHMKNLQVPVAKLVPVDVAGTRDPGEAVREIRELRKGATLGKISVREVINEGRRH